MIKLLIFLQDTETFENLSCKDSIIRGDHGKK